jgi:hypothetical protein
MSEAQGGNDFPEMSGDMGSEEAPNTNKNCIRRLFGKVESIGTRNTEQSMPGLAEVSISHPNSGRGVVSKASFGRPSPRDFEAMAKRRFQDPYLELVGQWWQIRIYQDEYSNGRRIRRRKRIRLALSIGETRG